VRRVKKFPLRANLWSEGEAIRLGPFITRTKNRSAGNEGNSGGRGSEPTGAPPGASRPVSQHGGKTRIGRMEPTSRTLPQRGSGGFAQIGKGLGATVGALPAIFIGPKPRAQSVRLEGPEVGSMAISKKKNLPPKGKKRGPSGACVEGAEIFLRQNFGQQNLVFGGNNRKGFSRGSTCFQVGRLVDRLGRG